MPSYRLIPLVNITREEIVQFMDSIDSGNIVDINNFIARLNGLLMSLGTQAEILTGLKVAAIDLYIKPARDFVAKSTDESVKLSRNYNLDRVENLFNAAHVEYSRRLINLKDLLITLREHSELSLNLHSTQSLTLNARANNTQKLKKEKNIIHNIAQKYHAEVSRWDVSFNKISNRTNEVHSLFNSQDNDGIYYQSMKSYISSLLPTWGRTDKPVDEKTTEIVGEVLAIGSDDEYPEVSLKDTTDSLPTLIPAGVVSPVAMSPSVIAVTTPDAPLAMGQSANEPAAESSQQKTRMKK